MWDRVKDREGDKDKLETDPGTKKTRAKKSKKSCVRVQNLLLSSLCCCGWRKHGKWFWVKKSYLFTLTRSLNCTLFQLTDDDQHNCGQWRSPSKSRTWKLLGWPLDIKWERDWWRRRPGQRVRWWYWLIEWEQKNKLIFNGRDKQAQESEGKWTSRAMRFVGR